MSIYEHEPAPPIKHKTTTGDYYLQGFSDGYHNRPPVIHRSQKARTAYMNGYNTGKAQASQQPTARP